MMAMREEGGESSAMDDDADVTAAVDLVLGGGK
jgi:hypothetical protein